MATKVGILLAILLVAPGARCQDEDEEVIAHHHKFTTKAPPVAELLDDRGLRRYRRAAHLAMEAIRKVDARRATAFVCWGNEDVFLYRLLSSAGIEVQFLRGREHTRAQRVQEALGDGIYRSAVIVDAACPFAVQVITLASRLRLFNMINTWVIFENGLLLQPAPPVRSYADVGDEFVDVDNVTVHRFGAQSREDALDPNEEAFLEVWPPSPPRVRAGLLQQDTDRLSAAVQDALDGQVVFLDSHVLWVQAAHEGRVEAFEVFRSCRVKPLQGYLVADSPAAPADAALRWRWTMDGHQLALLRERRVDLQGATLRGSTIIKFPDEYTDIEDNNLRQNDLYPKMNWPVTQNLGYSLNFGMLIYKRDNYGWDDGTGLFDGMMGEMQRYEHDLLATAVFIRPDRLPLIDLAAETFNTRTAMLFRQPSKSSVNNVYTLPFSLGVWRATAVVSVLAMLLLAVQTQWWRRHPYNAGTTDPADHLDVADCVTFIIGALSQQGFYCTPAMVSARITIITTFIANLFLFTSFSGSIVAIIQSPSNALRSVQDLLDSDMHVAVQDIIYHHVWFKEAVAEGDVAGKLYMKKIRSHNRPSFLSTREGIKKVRRGGFAFQVEVNDGYKEISDTFFEDEKCDLSEMELFPKAPMVFCTTERSPYREAITRNLRWQREAGLLDRLHHRWESGRPGCAGNVKVFVPIGLQEFYPALIVLYNGVLLSLAVLVAERVYKSRTVAACLSRARSRAYNGMQATKSNLPAVQVVMSAY